MRIDHSSFIIAVYSLQVQRHYRDVARDLPSNVAGPTRWIQTQSAGQTAKIAGWDIISGTLVWKPQNTISW